MLCSFTTAPLLNNNAHVRIHAPHLFKSAAPGHFVIIDEKFSCYIMGQSQDLEIIANPQLNEHLKHKQRLHLSSLQGVPLKAPLKSHSYLLMGENDALSAIIFYLKIFRKHFNGLVLLGSDSTFPFAPCPSRLLNSYLPSDVIAALPLFEDWGIPSRLASLVEAPGVYHGTVNELSEMWLAKMQYPIEKYTIPALE